MYIYDSKMHVKPAGNKGGNEIRGRAGTGNPKGGAPVLFLSLDTSYLILVFTFDISIYVCMFLILVHGMIFYSRVTHNRGPADMYRYDVDRVLCDLRLKSYAVQPRQRRFLSKTCVFISVDV